MEHAELVVHAKSDRNIAVQFNPDQFSVRYGARFADNTNISGLLPGQSYLGGQMPEFSVSLTLDGCGANRDILGDTASLAALTRVDSDLHRPPECSFLWGSTALRGFAQSVSVRYTLFSTEGKALRAVVELTVKVREETRPVRHSPDRTRRRVLSQDTSLWLLAWECYEDCDEWRRIADANGIRNPRRAMSGLELRIPAIEGVL